LNIRDVLKASVSWTTFSPTLYVNDLELDFVLLFDNSINFDEDPAGLLYQVKYQWQERTWLSEMTTPYMIWTGACGPIFPLDEVDLNQTLIEKFKTQGLSVILYEPLTTYRENIANNFIDHRNYDQFESTELNLNALRSFELDSINEFAQKYNFQQRIKVYTCNYRVAEYYQHKYEYLELFYRDLFISLDSFNNISYKNYYPKKLPHKKFCCLNRRYTGHRNLAMMYLATTNSFYSGNYSWNVTSDVGYLNDKLWFDIYNWQKTNPEVFTKIEENQERLNDILPLTVDQSNPNVHFVGDATRVDPPAAIDRNPRIVYAETFVSIVTETRFAEPTGNFSEKTTNPMKSYRPFILLAPPGTLELLHNLGFKTFGEFWDESYDQEKNHEQRLLKIFKVIDQIDAYSMYDVHYTLNKMKPILEHNAENLGRMSKELFTIPY